MVVISRKNAPFLREMGRTPLTEPVEGPAGKGVAAFHLCMEELVEIWR